MIHRSLVPLEHGAGVGAGGQGGVLAEAAGLITRRTGLPLLCALGEFLVAEPNAERVAGDVDVDHVARLQQGERPAGGGLGADVADAGAGRSAGESAVGNQSDAVVEPDALDGGGGGEHFLHSRPAARAFIANHDHVARLDPSADDSFVGLGFGVEDHGGAGVFEHFRANAGGLDHRPLRRQIAVKDHQPALLAVGVVDLADAVERVETEVGRREVADRVGAARRGHSLGGANAGGRDGGQFQRIFLDALGPNVVVGDVLAEGLAGHGGAVELQQAGAAAARRRRGSCGCRRSCGRLRRDTCCWGRLCRCSACGG